MTDERPEIDQEVYDDLLRELTQQLQTANTEIEAHDLPAIFAELPVVPAHLLGHTPLGEMRRAEFNHAPVGNGPFRFVSRVPGQRWTFERNPAFPEALGGPPRIRRLVIAVVDESGVLKAFSRMDGAPMLSVRLTAATGEPSGRAKSWPVWKSVPPRVGETRQPKLDVRA